MRAWDFLRFSEIHPTLHSSNFLTIWSWEKLLVPRNMYSARSVDSRGFFCFSMMVGYPYLVPDLEENYKNPHIWEFQEKISKILPFSGENIFEIFRTWLRGYQKFWKIKKTLVNQEISMSTCCLKKSHQKILSSRQDIFELRSNVFLQKNIRLVTQRGTRVLKLLYRELRIRDIIGIRISPSRVSLRLT